MKANELMIGDWVQDYGTNHRYKITSIVDEDPYQVMDEDGLPTDIGSVEPIPLTSNMLRINGWRELRTYEWKDGKYVTEWNCDDYAFKVLYCCGYDGFTFMGLDINHVHKLQHTLRLVGLNDLADNFIIK